MVACPLLVSVAKAMRSSFQSYIVDYCKDYRACQQVTISAWVDREVPMPLRTFEKRLATLWSAKIRSVGPEGVRRDALGGARFGRLEVSLFDRHQGLQSDNTERAGPGQLRCQ